jgi:hypothetical protein
MLDVVNAKSEVQNAGVGEGESASGSRAEFAAMACRLSSRQPVLEALQMQGKLSTLAEYAQASADISEIAGTQKWVRDMTPDEKKAIEAEERIRAADGDQGKLRTSTPMQQIAGQGRGPDAR